MSEGDWRRFDLFAPTPEHALLAGSLREFVTREVEPQAAAHDREERFNRDLFRRAGELGLLGVTISEEYGGADLDATAAVQVLEALSTSDPGFALAVLAHAVLFAQNVAVNGNDVQRKHVLPYGTAPQVPSATRKSAQRRWLAAVVLLSVLLDGAFGQAAPGLVGSPLRRTATLVVAAAAFYWLCTPPGAGADPRRPYRRPAYGSPLPLTALLCAGLALPDVVGLAVRFAGTLMRAVLG